MGVAFSVKKNNMEKEIENGKLKKIDIPFTQIANSVLNDKNLSLKAKGLFGYIYSKPVKWEFSVHRIENDSKDGRDSTMMALRELEKSGYLRRKKLKTGKVLYEISYKPDTENPNQDQKPDTENPTYGNPELRESRTISNKDNYSNKEIIINKEETLIKKIEKFVFQVEEVCQGVNLNEGHKNEIRKFIDYWTEPNKSHTKIKWEMEKTWDTKRRLKTWFTNAVKFNGGNKNNKYKVASV